MIASNGHGELSQLRIQSSSLQKEHSSHLRIKTPKEDEFLERLTRKIIPKENEAKKNGDNPKEAFEIVDFSLPKL